MTQRLINLIFNRGVILKTMQFQENKFSHSQLWTSNMNTTGITFTCTTIMKWNKHWMTDHSTDQGLLTCSRLTGFLVWWLSSVGGGGGVEGWLGYIWQSDSVIIISFHLPSSGNITTHYMVSVNLSNEHWLYIVNCIPEVKDVLKTSCNTTPIPMTSSYVKKYWNIFFWDWFVLLHI